MEDGRIWEFEHALWVGGPEAYRAKVDPACVMALPAQPFLHDGEGAIRAVEHTPRWERAEFTEQRVSRPEEGLIVIGYRIDASRGEEHYRALCTSTLRRIAHEEWRVVQHQQTPFGIALAGPAA